MPPLLLRLPRQTRPSFTFPGESHWPLRRDKSTDWTRHTEYDSIESVPYRLTVKTVDHGDIEIPQIGESLFLNRRDSKIHVSDYAVGDKHLIYSSAEVFTW